MNQNTILIFLILSFKLCTINYSQAQNKTVDSLLSVLEKSKDDTIKVNILNEICWALKNTGNYTDAVSYAEKAISISEKASFRSGLGKACHNLGCIYDDMGDNVNALKNYAHSLEIRTELNDKSGIAGLYNNIGVIYMQQGNYPEALKNYYASLKIKEELGERKETAATYGNIGIIHDYQSNYPEALKNYKICLEIMNENGNQGGVAACYNNIGLVYYAQNIYQEALTNFKASLKIREEIDDKSGVATAYMNIGELFLKQENFTEALANYNVALSISVEIGDQEGIADTYIDMGKIYTKLNKLKEAKIAINKGLSLAKEIGYTELIRNGYMNLSMAESKAGNWKEAHQNYLLFITYRDSIDNEEYNRKSMEASMQYEFDKKASADSVRHAETQKVKDVRLALQEAQIEEERIKKYALFGGLGLVLVFTGFIFNRFRLTRRQKEIIQNQKEIVEFQKHEVEIQKTLVEEKNRDMLDSIHYAKRIQDALLKEEAHVSSHLPEHFILFRPKDIVSGDFYWGLEKRTTLLVENKETIHWYLAAADCTGHGVPGAFLTMLGTSFLNEINATDKLLSPAEILDQLREKFIRELGQTGKDGESKDGMDISLICLALKDNKPRLNWAGANNPLWIINPERTSWPENVLPFEDGTGGAEIKPDKQPIGFCDDPLPFTNHSFQLMKGDTIYIFTDGFADQFGGERGKKFMYKNLKKTLLSIATLPMAEQRNKLNEVFESWKGDLEQVDDVCVIGVRV